MGQNVYHKNSSKFSETKKKQIRKNKTTKALVKGARTERAKKNIRKVSNSGIFQKGSIAKPGNKVIKRNLNTKKHKEE